jgi:hypothetical protein
MIHDEIVTYEVAKLAKEKGFPQECDMFYNRNGKLCDERNYDSFDNGILYYAPTRSLLQRWLREEKDIQIIIEPKLDKFGAWVWGYYDWVIRIYNEYSPIYYSQYNGDNFDTYELALEDSLAYSLKNLV